MQSAETCTDETLAPSNAMIVACLKEIQGEVRKCIEDLKSYKTPSPLYVPILGPNDDDDDDEQQQRKQQWKMKCTIVDNDVTINVVKNVGSLFSSNYGYSSNEEVIIDYYGNGGRKTIPTELYFIIVASKEEIYFFDCIKLDPQLICPLIQPLLQNPKKLKIMHDIHMIAAIFHKYSSSESTIQSTSDSNNNNNNNNSCNHNKTNNDDNDDDDDNVNINAVYDTQLFMEAATSNWNTTVKEMLQHCNVPDTYNGRRAIVNINKDKSRYAQRPLPPQLYDYMTEDTKYILQAFEHQCTRIDMETFMGLSNASKSRYMYAAMNHGERNLCFDIEDNYEISSYEYMKVLDGDGSRICSPTPIVVSNDATPLIDLLPEDLAQWFCCDNTNITTKVQKEDEKKDLSATEDEKTDNIPGYRTELLFEIVLDKGRPPYAWIGSKQREVIGSDSTRLVLEEDIQHITRQLCKFGSDNRAGLERQLHRIAAIRNRNNDIIGLTMRVGRHVSGNAYMIADLLYGYPTESILFLGEPGSGKTTVVREVTRLLAEQYNVCIVDTSNEIAGDGDVPHPCVGHARRMMVPTLDQQSQVMIECVQNHTPEIIVIDEIGRSNEVEAARTCKNRGVRLIASAHGDLRKLLKNPKLRGLVGGVERVTIGDEEARKIARQRGQSQIQKNKSERGGAPTFEIIVELKRGVHNEWTVTFDSGSAVDQILEGKEYSVQRRIRNPITGAIHIVMDRA